MAERVPLLHRCHRRVLVDSGGLHVERLRDDFEEGVSVARHDRTFLYRSAPSGKVSTSSHPWSRYTRAAGAFLAVGMNVAVTSSVPWARKRRSTSSSRRVSTRRPITRQLSRSVSISALS